MEAGNPDKPRRKAFALVDGDIELIKLVYEFRFARIDNLALLTGRAYKKVHGRVFKLAEHGYLKTIKLPLQKHIYAIGAKAVHVLVEQGAASAELATQRLRSHELKELFLKHEMMVVDIHTMLRAAGTGTIKLVAWREGPELFDRVEVRGRERRFLPMRPDAMFTLEDSSRPAGQNQISAFLEADRSTTTHARFEEKLVAYWNYLQQGMHERRYGIRSFRTVTVAITRERAVNLCSHAARVLPPQAHRYFLFGSLADCPLAEPSRMLGAVFATPKDPSGRERVFLVPPRTALALSVESG
jgi:hypothetical protein